MKKYILMLIIAIAATVTCSASPQKSVDSIFTEFSTANDAEYVKVNSFMMWLGKMFMGNEPGTEIVKKVKSVRVLDLEDCSNDVKSQFKERLKGLRESGLEEVMRMNDDGDKVQVYAQVDQEKMSKLIVVSTGGDDCALIEINGNFEKNDLAAVVKDQVSKQKNGGK